jgi:hypothetical protein
MAHPTNEQKTLGVPFVEMADIEIMARFGVPYVNICGEP